MNTAENDTVLYLRKEVQSDYNEDEWDDSKLIKAFDKAVSKAKIQIMKKIQNELGLKEEDIPDSLSDAASIKKKKKKNKKNKNNKKINWSVGDACRAIYSEDGEEYEAKIIDMIDKLWCKVKYVGYNNEEQVLLKDLIPSLGRNVIQLQMEMAKQDALIEGLTITSQEEDEYMNEELHTRNPREAIHKPSASTSKQRPPVFRRYTPQRPAMFDPSAPLPPPPPMPPFASIPMSEKLFGGVPHPQLPTGNDAHHAMLMSWYMCGYYTGAYERDLMNHETSNYQYQKL